MLHGVTVGSGRSTSFVNRPIVVLEQAGKKNKIVFRTFFSARFGRDFSVKIQVTSVKVLGGDGGHATFGRRV